MVLAATKSGMPARTAWELPPPSRGEFIFPCPHAWLAAAAAELGLQIASSPCVGPHKSPEKVPDPFNPHHWRFLIPQSQFRGKFKPAGPELGGK